MATVQEALQQGLTHQRSGDLAAAEQVYRQILSVAPAHPDVLHLLGLIASQQGRADEAIARIGEAIAGDSSAALYHHNLANVYLAQQRLAEAEASYRSALAVQPDYLLSQRQLAALLHASGRTEESAHWWRRVLQRSPEDADALNNLGVILADGGEFPAAREHYQAALRSRPNFAQAQNNLGNTFVAEDDFAAAEAAFLSASRLDPRFAAAHHNLGLLRAHQGRLFEAEAGYRRAIELEPDDASAHADLGLLLLLQGDCRRGWSEFEWRRKLPALPQRKFAQPRWDGTALAGRTILLHAEEGLGDTLQFVRMAGLVSEAGSARQNGTVQNGTVQIRKNGSPPKAAGRVILECPASLCELMQTMVGIDQVVASGQPLPAFDVHAPLLAVPAILKLTLPTIPCQVPYLAADARRVDHWRQRLRAEPGFKVGIVWQGRPTFRFDAWRSIPLSQFEPLANVPGVRLYSLQKGVGSEQLAAAGKTFAVTDLGRDLDNGGSAFVDTAAVLKNLDLIITSDTAMAHLAGALGVPAWVALPLAPDWRWLLDRDDSPWYPTLRLFRQTERRQWPEVFARMAAALAEAVALKQQVALPTSTATPDSAAKRRQPSCSTPKIARATPMVTRSTRKPTDQRLSAFALLPLDTDSDWGSCGRHLACELSKLADVKLICPDFDDATPSNDLELRYLRSLLASPQQIAALQSGHEHRPVLQAVSGQFLEPIGPAVPASWKVGYACFESLLADECVRHMADTFDLIATGSSWCTSILEERGLERLATVTQGIDPQRFHPGLAQKQWILDHWVVFSGGPFELRKGQDLVIRAYKVLQDRHADVMLVNAWHNPAPATRPSMVSSPHIAYQPSGAEHVTDIEAMLVQCGIDLDRVVTLGEMPDSALPDVYRNTDVGLFPNRCEGSTNRVLMEYMACAKPVIASYTSGQRDVLTTQNAILLERLQQVALKQQGQRFAIWDEPNLDEVVERLEWAYQHRAELRPVAEQAGRDLAVRTWRRMAEEFVKLLNRSSE